MFTTQTNETFHRIEDHRNDLPEISEEELVDKYQLNECVKWITENKYEKTCLQFPEELLNDGTSATFYIQNALGKTVYLLGDTSYGSCCVDEVAAEHVSADSIIHFGHACLSPVVKLPVYYVFLKENFNIEKLCSKLEIFNKTDVIIFYDDIYSHLYNKIHEVFKDCDNVYVSKLNKELEKVETNGNTKLLCGRIFALREVKDISAVFVGDEKSTTLENLVLNLPDIKWYHYNPKNDVLQDYKMNRNKFLMKRMALVEKIKEADTIGILIGTLGIKNYLNAINRIKALVRKNGKKCYKLAVGKPNVAKLANFPEIDVFVCISCQENSLLKDFTGYYKPIVSLMEVEMALGGRTYSLEYTSDFRELLPGGSFYRESDYETENSEPKNPGEQSQDLMERDAGTIVESSGARFLSSRSWQGLEQRIGETEVCKAVKGRSGIPQGYDHEMSTPDGEPENLKVPT